MYRQLFFGILLVLPGLMPAQTCCSGGVPLSSNLGMPAAETGDLQLALTYDLNVLKTLKEGTSQLDDQSRNRTTQSVLWQLGYNFSKKIAIDALFSYVRQERTIRNGQREDFVRTEGIGDAVLLLKYQVWESRQSGGGWTLGLGGRFPTGASDRVNTVGIRLNADLQPGSGANDLIFWSQFFRTGILRPSMNLFTTLTYNLRGINRDYLPIYNPADGTTQAQQYQFGNEWQWITGLTDRILIGNTIIDPGVSIRFRSVQFDRINDQRLPSTGGTWWFLNPNLTWWFNPRFSFNVNAELPVYANIIGTQLSPTFRLNTGLFFRLDFDGKSTAELPDQLRIY